MHPFAQVSCTFPTNALMSGVSDSNRTILLEASGCGRFRHVHSSCAPPLPIPLVRTAAADAKECGADLAVQALSCVIPALAAVRDEDVVLIVLVHVISFVQIQ